jgi:hypothetical protein
MEQALPAQCTTLRTNQDQHANDKRASAFHGYRRKINNTTSGFRQAMGGSNPLSTPRSTCCALAACLRRYCTLMCTQDGRCDIMTPVLDLHFGHKLRPLTAAEPAQ